MACAIEIGCRHGFDLRPVTKAFVVIERVMKKPSPRGEMSFVGTSVPVAAGMAAGAPKHAGGPEICS